MLKYSINNTGGDPITVFGRNSLHIPAHAESIFALPDTPQTRKLMARLSREYPLLRIASPIAELSETSKKDSPVPTPAEATAKAVPLDKDAFAAAVKEVKVAGSGWSTVEIEGIAEPIRVRGGKDDAATIALAFDVYLKMPAPVISTAPTSPTVPVEA